MKKKVLAIMAMAVFSVGCFKHTYTVGSGASTAGTPRLSEWRHFFIGGLIGSAEVDVRAVCPSGNATIVNYHGFLQMLISYIVLGGWLWQPTTVEVYCNESGTTSQVVIPAETLNAFVHSPEFREAVALDAPEHLDAVLAALALSPGDAVCASR